MKILRNILLGFAAVLLLIAAGYFFLPWKSFLEGRLIVMIYSRGFQNIAFNIEDVGLRHARLVNVVLGKEHPLVLKSVDLRFTPEEILSGSMNDIVLDGVTFEVRKEGNDWNFTGRDIVASRSGNGKVDLAAILSSLPFQSLTLQNSSISVVSEEFSGTIPLTATLTPKALAIQTQPTEMFSGARKISLGAVNIALAANAEDTNWKGVWTLDKISVEDLADIPPMTAKGSLALDDTTLKADGTFTDVSKAYNGKIDALYDMNDASKTGARVASASFPFKQGKVSVHNVKITMPVTIPVTIQKVSVDELMSSLTGDRVSATGTLSGTVPVTIRKDGSYSIGKGSLKADGNGTIQMSADLIPSNQEQVTLVRQILENLHYSVLSAQVENGKGGKMTVRLMLEGNNPDVYNGREVKLTINLTGDILDFIQQNIMLFNSPEKLIEQDGR